MTLTLDLAALGDNDGHVLIPTFPGNGQPYSVTLGWTGKTPSGDIPLTLPPQNVSNPASEQARFVIPNTHLKSIAGGSAAVRYTLVQNGAPANRESETTNVTVTSLPVVLTAPLVVEANGTLVLDLAQISGSAVNVMIAAWIGQRAGDRVILNWAGTPPVSDPATPFAPVNYTDEYVVQPGGEQNPVTFSVPLEHLTPVGGGTLQVSYQVVFKASGSSQTSPVTAYSVTAAALVFPAPLIPEAPAGTLKPMDVLAGATFRATYPGMQTSDIIIPVWNDISSGIRWRPGEADGTVESTVPPNIIGAAIGKTIDVRYQVQRNGQDYWSDDLKLMVEAIPSESSPAPVVPEADQATKVLDLNEFEGDAHVTVVPWPFIALGQTIWLTLTGPSGVPTIKLLEGYVIRSGEVTDGLNVAIKRSELKTFEDGSDMQIVCKVGLEGAQDEAAALTFPTVTLSLKVLTTLIIENFDSMPNQNMYAGDTVDTPVFSIHVSSTEGFASIWELHDPAIPMPFPPIPGKIEKMALHLNHQYSAYEQTLNINFRETYSKLSFFYIWARECVDFSVFDQDGNILSSQVGPKNEGYTPNEIIFNHRDMAGINISNRGHGHVQSWDWVVLDCFRLER